MSALARAASGDGAAPIADTTAATRLAVTRAVQFFETLTPQSVAQFGQVYTDDVAFKDPFNEVRGLSEVQRIFSHMYVALEAPRFVVTQQVVDGAQCFLCWDFHFAFRGDRSGRQQRIRGTSHLQFAADGRIFDHRDYWDAAEELYEKLPLLGALMRWLKRRANR